MQSLFLLLGLSLERAKKVFKNVLNSSLKNLLIQKDCNVKQLFADSLKTNIERNLDLTSNSRVKAILYTYS